jgi:hypothetical protein
MLMAGLVLVHKKNPALFLETAPLSGFENIALTSRDPAQKFWASSLLVVDFVKALADQDGPPAALVSPGIMDIYKAGLDSGEYCSPQLNTDMLSAMPRLMVYTR